MGADGYDIQNEQINKDTNKNNEEINNNKNLKKEDEINAKSNINGNIQDNIKDKSKNNDIDNHYLTDVKENEKDYKTLKTKIKPYNGNRNTYKNLKIKDLGTLKLKNRKLTIESKNKKELKSEYSLYSFNPNNDILNEYEAKKNEKLRQLKAHNFMNRTSSLIDKEGLVFDIFNIKKEIELINFELNNLRKIEQTYQQRHIFNKEILEKILNIEDNENEDEKLENGQENNNDKYIAEKVNETKNSKKNKIKEKKLKKIKIMKIMKIKKVIKI